MLKRLSLRRRIISNYYLVSSLIAPISRSSSWGLWCYRHYTSRMFRAQCISGCTNINREAGSEYVRFYPDSLKLHDYNAKVGIAFDGDADRVVFVDCKGQLYDGDMVLAMLSLKLRTEQRLRQNTVVITPMSNSGLRYYLTATWDCYSRGTKRR